MKKIALVGLVLSVSIALVGCQSGINTETGAYGELELIAEIIENVTQETEPLKGNENPDATEPVLTLNDVVDTDAYKENIYNNMLNSVDYYDAVEGSFITTLWGGDGQQAVVSYASDINTQKSYQEVYEENEGEGYKIFVTGGNEYTIDTKNKTQRVLEMGFWDTSREKQEQRIFSPSSYTVSANGETTTRVGEKDGVPVYYYRSDLTNCGYAATSIFPQALTFGLLTDFESWEVVATDMYLDRSVIVLQGKVSDLDYSKKINSNTFELKIDAETGIILEFTGYDLSGHETESMKTTNISILKNASNGTSDIASFVDSSLSEYLNYEKITRR